VRVAHAAIFLHPFMATIPIIWIGGSVLVAILGRKSSVGPWGFLLFSLIFSPLVGAMGLFVTGRRRSVSISTPADVVRLTAAVQSLQTTAREQQNVLEQLREQLKKSASL
jgi:hypothetical protein